MDIQTRLGRWRLILGQESQSRFGQMGGEEPTGEMDLMDQALAAIYNRVESGGFGNRAGQAFGRFTDHERQILFFKNLVSNFYIYI